MVVATVSNSLSSRHKQSIEKVVYCVGATESTQTTEEYVHARNKRKVLVVTGEGYYLAARPKGSHLPNVVVEFIGYMEYLDAMKTRKEAREKQGLPESEYEAIIIAGGCDEVEFLRYWVEHANIWLLVPAKVPTETASAGVEHEEVLEAAGFTGTARNFAVVAVA